MTTAAMTRMVRVAVAGGGATAIDTLVLLALYRLAGVAAGSAAVCGCLVGGAVNFVVNRRWVFRAAAAALWKQAVLYAIVIVGGSALVTGTIVAGLHRLGMSLVIAKLAAIGIVLVGWTYPMSARVVFRNAPCTRARR